MRTYHCDRCGNPIPFPELLTITLSPPVIPPCHQHELCRECATKLGGWLQTKELSNNPVDLTPTIA